MNIWNPNAEQSLDLQGREGGHPAVRSTSYGEIHELLGTAGCSNDANMWSWMVMGVIETTRGRLVAFPGDVILEIAPGIFIPVTPESISYTPEPTEYDDYPVDRDYQKDKGDVYRLLFIANAFPTKPNVYPVAVYVKASDEKKVWTKPFSEFKQKFTLIK